MNGRKNKISSFTPIGTFDTCIINLQIVTIQKLVPKDKNVHMWFHEQAVYEKGEKRFCLSDFTMSALHFNDGVRQNSLS